MIDHLEEYFKEKEKMMQEMNLDKNSNTDYFQVANDEQNATVYDTKENASKKLDSSKPNVPWLQYPGNIGCPDAVPIKPNKPNPWNPNLNCKLHIVKKGDTLYKIAKANGIKVIDMLMANPYVDVYNLQIGEELCIPINRVNKVKS